MVDGSLTAVLTITRSVEMARAFAAPLMVSPGAADAKSNDPVEEVLERIGKTKVRYGDVVVPADAQSGTCTERETEVEKNAQGGQEQRQSKGII